MKWNHVLAWILPMSLIVSLAPGPLCAQQNASRPATELVGLWKAEKTLGPEIKGTLTILQRGDTWAAQIAGHTIAPAIQGDRISFVVPGDRGEFRGRFENDGADVSGHWIQPATDANWVRFASPVYLKREGMGVWTGEVRPMEDKMTFYLPLRRNADGTVSGFLRNPEANFGRLFQIDRVVIEHDRISFLESGRAGTRLPVTHYPDFDIFSIYIPDAGGSFDFRRVTLDPASNFFPRPKSDPPYSYHPPLPAGDGWDVASLDEVGMAVGPVEDLVRLIIATPMDSIASPYTHAMLIARHGKLVVEEYFHGYTADMPHETRSAAKSITSTLIGIASNNGAPIDVSTPVYDLMYDGRLPSNLDERKKRMTLKHLLTMTPGLACDDNDDDSPGQEDLMQEQTKEPNWAQYTLDLPMVHEPGELAAYCSGSTNLAGDMLRKATDTWIPEFYQKHFAEPMQMGLYHMNLMPNGEAYGGGGLYIMGRDFLKMGQIFLDGGSWKGERLLTDEWVRDAISPIEHMFDQGYGYGWWVLDYPYKDGAVQAFYAGGNGGQYVIGIPELDLVIVFFGGNYGQSVLHKPKREYVPNYIVKAVELGGE